MTNTFQVTSPIDNSSYLEKAYTTDNKVNKILINAKRAKEQWKQVSIQERADICLKAVEEIVKNKATLAEEITHQMGRPIQYSEGEIAGFAERARYMIGIAGETLSNLLIDKKRFIQRDPLGVVLTMSPWNYPYLTAVNTIIPAIMAGNSVILKPSAQTPLTAERLDAAFHSAMLPQGVFQTLLIDHEAAHKLVQHEAIDYIAFTGSVAGGRSVQHAVKDRFVGLGLELGGKDAAYVRADADLSSTVASLVDGVYFNSGQSCCGIERIYVDQSIYTDFVDQFCHHTTKYVLDDPRKTSTTLGPMVSVNAANRVRQQIKDAVAAGALLGISPEQFAEPNPAYLAPQVLTNVDHTMRVMRDESFGPIVGIMPVTSDTEAIELMNDSEFGLTASVWTENEKSAMAIGSAVNVGTFFMNRCDTLDPALAWSGMKNSGRGCTLSALGYEQLTRPKSFHFS